MGNFYANITLAGPTQTELLNYLRKESHDAYVSPTLDGFTVVYERECDNQNERILHSLTSELSKEFNCPALFVVNHDDDVLIYAVYQNGSCLEDYNSDPTYFTENDEEPVDQEVDENGRPVTRLGSSIASHDPTPLCTVFNRLQAIARLKVILRLRSWTFAIEQHQAIAEALGLPPFLVGSGFRYIEQGEEPQGISLEDLKNTM